MSLVHSCFNTYLCQVNFFFWLFLILSSTVLFFWKGKKEDFNCIKRTSVWKITCLFLWNNAMLCRDPSALVYITSQRNESFTHKYFPSASYFSLPFSEKQVLKQLWSKTESKFIATVKGTQSLFPIASHTCML